MNRRTAAAGFRELRRLEEFDFGFNRSIKKDRIFGLPWIWYRCLRRAAKVPAAGLAH